MTIEAEIHDGIVSSNTYEELIIFMLSNQGHKMCNWAIKLYLSKLESKTSSDGLPYVQPWLYRYCTGSVFFLTRELTESEKLIVVLRHLLSEVNQSGYKHTAQSVIVSVKSAGIVVPVDDEFPLVKLACIYNDESACR